MKLKFENTYAQLDESFFERRLPTPVASARLIQWNTELATSLGLHEITTQSEVLAEYFSGNKIIEGSQPLAQVYAGHQFGHFSEQLGDGRALLLGEWRDPQAKLWDIQLKGAGLTRYSRGGDGRAALGPMIREYLLGEFMFALGIPTTRALALVSSGEFVYRQTPLPGAILTRVASSHIRVGTFEYFHALQEQKHLKDLADYTIRRHFPSVLTSDAPYLEFFKNVVKSQAHLIAQWMSVGFVHGVMNTDNMSVSGETIDYGPCAFLDEYDPMAVFSSIDRQGRYAYARQPSIAMWNLSRLGHTLLFLFDDNKDSALEKMKAAVESFSDHFQLHILKIMSRKLGYELQNTEQDAVLIQNFLELMAKSKTDYTHSFDILRKVIEASQNQEFWNIFGKTPESQNWLEQWRNRIFQDSQNPLQVYQNLREANPSVIARNHQVERAIKLATEQNDFQAFENLLKAVKSPFEDTADNIEFQKAPLESEKVLATFCGT